MTDKENSIYSENKAWANWDRLSDLEKAYLCYMAYTGMKFEVDHFKLPSVEGLNNISIYERTIMNTNLKNKGFIREVSNKSTNYYNPYATLYEIEPSIHVKTLVYMFTEHKEWIKSFKSQRITNEWYELIVNIALFMCGEDVDITKYKAISTTGEVVLEEYQCEVIEGALTMEGWERLADGMSDDMKYCIVMDLLSDSECLGNPGKLQMARNLLERHKIETTRDEYLYEALRLDWFYYTGEVIDKVTDNTFLPDMYLDAALSLYNGKTDDAIDQYDSAIQFSEPYVTVKGIPNDALTLLLYVIALSIRKNAKDLETLQGLNEKIEQHRKNYFKVISHFVTYLKDKHQTVSKDFRYLEQSASHLAKGIANLYRIYIEEKPGEKSISETDCALLQNEIWGMGGCTEKGTMPFEPLLGKIKRKEPWEFKLAAILEKTGLAETKDDNVDRSKRIIYYIGRGYYNNIQIDVKVQKKTKKGDWSRGAMIDDFTWRYGNKELDNYDKKIRFEWGKPGNNNFSQMFYIVLKYCKGTDKLYTDYENGGYGPVEIIEEKPYIFTERKNGRIYFHSNVPDKSMENMYEWSNQRRTITYWDIEGKEREVFCMIAQLGNVPETAEPMLEKLMAVLVNRVEVQSDIQGGMTLEEKEGSSIVTVRITPERGGFVAGFMIRPLEGGYKYVPAGKGDETIVDSDGVKRYKVVRNLKSEKSNCKRVWELLGFEGRVKEAVLDTRSLLMLMENAEEMSDVYCIEWPKGEGLKVLKPSASAWNINAVGKGGWFEIEGELRVSEGRILTIAQLLEMVKGGEGQYVRLSSGEYLKLSKKIRSQLGQLDAVSQTSRGKVTVTELAMTFMKDALDDIVDVKDYEMVEERKRLMREAANKDYPLPEGLNAVLRPYQEDGYRWLMSLSHWGAGACLADDMGLGKTVQSIAFMLAKAQEGPQMVVAPASVIGNWRKELARFSPGLRVTMLNEMGSSERGEVLDSVGAGNVVVTTYGLLVTEKKAITGVKWETVVLDEAHTIKNKETKMSAVAMKLEAANKIMLTGTPVQNHLGELWNLFRFINPGLLGSYEHFQEKFVGGENNGSREALKRLVAPFLLRRTKNEVVRELPDKVEMTIPVQMQEDEMAVYEVIRRQAKAELEMGGPLSVNALAMMTKLRMAACSAVLAEKNWKGGCSKLDALMEKLLPIVESGNSVLVFSQFTSFLSMARERLSHEGVTSFLYLDGSTPVAKRQKMVEQFQRGEQQVFLISLKAGGLGLNLTGANYVIHLDPWWNPAIEQQATDRAYRIGQQQKVTVYHLIAEGTIEEKILRLHDTKREMADQILEGRSTAMRLTPEELMELIR